VRKKRLKRVWRNLITSGLLLSVEDFEDYERCTKLIFINTLALLGAGLFFILSVSRLANLQFFLVFADLAAVAVFTAVIVILRRTLNTEASGSLIVALLFAVLVVDLLRGSAVRWALVVSTVLPVLAFYLLGRRKGLRAASCLLHVYLVLIGLMLLQIIPTPYAAPLLLAGLSAYAVIGALAFLAAQREEKIHFLLKKRIYYDPLTKLPNRALLLKHIAESDSPALLILNIDDFKEINATYGYQAGDSVLQSAAETLKHVVPDSVCGVYRLSGDEFAVLMNRGQDSRFQKKVTHVASLVSRFLRHEKYHFLNADFRIRTSMGIALAEEVGVDRLFACADLALQTAKGTNHPFLFYQEAVDTKRRYEENIRWAYVLTEALDNGRAVPYYQPIVNNITGRTEIHECLVRLIDNEGQVVNPDYFLDIAKKSRLYTRITKTMLRKAVEFVKGNPTSVSINLSLEDILDQTVLDYINKVLSENPSARTKVCFEITESEGIENFGQVSRFFRQMKKWGCRIAIDDFGSGYSNFDYLTHLEIDLLKIDGSLIRNIHKDHNSRLIVEKIVAFARQIGITTIAEYVESEEILKAVKELNIDYSQGFFLGEPKPAHREGIACIQAAGLAGL
jgi:diguanylate cyclase (GGDEF)-like protein